MPLSTYHSRSSVLLHYLVLLLHSSVLLLHSILSSSLNLSIILLLRSVHWTSHSSRLSISHSHFAASYSSSSADSHLVIVGVLLESSSFCFVGLSSLDQMKTILRSTVLVVTPVLIIVALMVLPYFLFSSFFIFSYLMFRICIFLLLLFLNELCWSWWVAVARGLGSRGSWHGSPWLGRALIGSLWLGRRSFNLF